MNTLILNREFKLPADGYIQIVPKGEFPVTVTPDQFNAFRNAVNPGNVKSIRVMQVLDDAACENIINAFAAKAAAADFAGLPLDYDHFSDDPNRSSEVAGWIMDLQNRADGIYAKVRWAGDGENKVTSGAFRFISPVFTPPNCELIGNNRVRPLSLIEAALTNRPNMRSIRPITNSETPENKQTADIPAEKGNTMKDKLAALLKLEPTATDDDVLAAIQKLIEAKAEVAAVTNRATAAEAKIKEFEAEKLNTLVEADLEKFKNRIKNRDEVKALLLKNREDGIKILENIPEPAAATTGKILNRADGKTPSGQTESEAQRLSSQQALIDDIKIKNRCSSIEAASIAASRNPELFGKIK